MVIKKIGVIGAGNIGTSLAADTILRGIQTVLIDHSTEQLKKAEENIVKSFCYSILYAGGRTAHAQPGLQERFTL